MAASAALAVAGWAEDEWEPYDDNGFVYKRLKRLNPSTTTTPDPTALDSNKTKRRKKKKALLKLKHKYLAEISRWELLSNTLRVFEKEAEIRVGECSVPSTSSGRENGEVGLGEESVDLGLRRRIDELAARLKISKWELLSNTLRVFEKEAQNRVYECSVPSTSSGRENCEVGLDVDLGLRRRIDDLAVRAFENRMGVREEGSTSSGRENSEVGLGLDVDLLIRRRIGELDVRVDADHAVIQGVSDLCDVAEAICSAQEQELKKQFLDLPIFESPRKMMKVLCDTQSESDNGD